VNELKDLHDLFAASVGAAAGLIGLLFVAVSVDPDKIFGSSAELKRRSDAERAFTALSNIFFVSLAALLTHNVQATVAVIASLAIFNSLRLGWTRFRLTAGWSGWRTFGLVSVAIYVFELVAALGLNTSDASIDKIVYTLFGLYSYALGTSWGLLGATGAPKAAPPG
jgi:nucleoside recognition membrane protein YjiH